MQNLPLYIPIIFGIITFTAVFIFFKASKSKTALFIILGWMLVQSVISLTGFYSVTNTFPPRFALLIFPPLVFIAVFILSNRGKKFMNNLDLKTLTWIHILRIPIELVLFGLFIYKTIPQIMTFEGRNLDILSGIGGIIIISLAFRHGKINRKLLLIYNIISLALLLNIVVIAILSMPFPFQQFGFNQPNTALFRFPFIWLPCCIVPMVLFSHIAAIRLLLTNPQNSLAGMQHSF